MTTLGQLVAIADSRHALPRRPVNMHDLAAVDRLARQCRVDPQQVRRLRNAYYKQHGDVAPLTGAAGGDDAWFAGRIEFESLTLARRDDSARDGATKLLLRTADDRLIESVILRMKSGRNSLCVSTQVGCAAGCRFCATGQMGLARNLTTAEILDQLVLANRLLAPEGRAIRNLVFMGMGEPFHNEARLCESIDVLTDRRAFNLHPRRIVVSTVGLGDAMIRLATRYPQVRLALSLHSARQEVRQRLMPVAAHHDLSTLRAAIERVNEIQQHPVMIEYLMLADINDSPGDARALVALLGGLAVHVNLIPFNPIGDAGSAAGETLRASRPARHEAFSRALKAAGFPVTTRYSLGADIAAACGQLVREHADVRARRVAQRSL